MMQGHAAKRDYRSGFTLLELLAVIMIAGLLAAVSVPAFNALLKGTALKTGAKALTDTFSFARQFAIANRRNCHVELVYLADDDQRKEGADDNSYRVYYLDAEDKEVTVRDWKRLPQFVEFDRNDKPPDEIIFKPTGGAYQAAGGSPETFRVLHTRSGKEGEEKAMEINVAGLTGRVTSQAVEID